MKALLKNSLYGLACASVMMVSVSGTANAGAGGWSSQGYGTTMYATNTYYPGSVIQALSGTPSTAIITTLNWNVSSTFSTYDSGKRYRIIQDNAWFIDVTSASGVTSAFAGLPANRQIQFVTSVQWPTTKIMTPAINVGAERVSVTYSY
jgi:hypothetical protein